MVGVLSNKIDRNELKPGDHIYSWRHSYLYAHHGIYVGDGKVIHFTRAAGHEIGTGTILDRIIISSSPCHSSDIPCPRCGDQPGEDGVISSCLECFLSGGELYLYQYGVSPVYFLAKARGGTCTFAKSDPTGAVLHRAEYLLQNGFGVYNIFKNNCEDFANYCKTGLVISTSVDGGRSGQATTFFAAAKAFASTSLPYMITSAPRLAVAPSLGVVPGVVVVPGLVVASSGIYAVYRVVYDIGVRRDVIKIPVEELVSTSAAFEPDSAAETPNNEMHED